MDLPDAGWKIGAIPNSADAVKIKKYFFNNLEDFYNAQGYK